MVWPPAHLGSHHLVPVALSQATPSCSSPVHQQGSQQQQAQPESLRGGRMDHTGRSSLQAAPTPEMRTHAPGSQPCKIWRQSFLCSSRARNCDEPAAPSVRTHAPGSHLCLALPPLRWRHCCLGSAAAHTSAPRTGAGQRSSLSRPLQRMSVADVRSRLHIVPA